MEWNIGCEQGTQQQEDTVHLSGSVQFKEHRWTYAIYTVSLTVRVAFPNYELQCTQHEVISGFETVWKNWKAL